ncbi:unnamed protein product [Protopolystoma xenopodis]|uniref:Uncharacterized protein n=1 Tax=Protopolystoma xenopodis TaxID=117903 RepID=A0A3S5CIX5_9PLAT|nr:unnamed protein product [Protopolystoma xenopodis]
MTFGYLFPDSLCKTGFRDSINAKGACEATSLSALPLPSAPKHSAPPADPPDYHKPNEPHQRGTVRSRGGPVIHVLGQSPRRPKAAYNLSCMHFAIFA